VCCWGRRARGRGRMGHRRNFGEKDQEGRKLAQKEVPCGGRGVSGGIRRGEEGARASILSAKKGGDILSPTTTERDIPPEPPKSDELERRGPDKKRDSQSPTLKRVEPCTSGAREKFVTSKKLGASRKKENRQRETPKQQTNQVFLSG